MSLFSARSKSMFGRIFSSMLVFTLAVLIVFAAVLTAIFFNLYEHDAADSLMAQAEAVALDLEKITDASGEDGAVFDTLNAQLDSTRYTLIGPDGTVLFDNQADASTMENHAQRPEVVAAITTGEATSSRHSATLGTDTLYVAVLLDNGSVLRLAETRHSLMAFLENMLIPTIVALCVVAVLCYFASRYLARRILQPLEHLDFTKPLQSEVYEEMNPLVDRILNQQSQLKLQYAELAEAQNMRRDFSSNVTHEMKTPLQVILGYAELMKNNLIEPADQIKFASLIYDEAQAMRLLIDDVLTLSRLDESSLDDSAEPIELFSAAQSMARRLDVPSAKAGVTVQVEGEPAFILGNQTLAEEMLYNIIENGIRYNYENGSVSVLIQNDLEAHQVVVCVSDTGPGIPAEYRDKIFERFFRIEKSRSKETGGTGLGLAIVKHATLYHKGTIKVRDGKDGGTTFEIRIPAYEGSQRDRTANRH